MTRQPTFYITHGGGPCFWADLPQPLGPGAYDGLKVYFEGLLASLPERPKAVLIVSAHWESDRPTVTGAARPGMLYDYYGFPDHTYKLRYPAPGHPVLAGQIIAKLEAAGVPAARDDMRGFDHAVFVPMMIIDHEAQLPVVTLSLQRQLDPALHLQIGKALAALREQGVLIIGSGSSFHDLRAIFRPGVGASLDFDGWLQEVLTKHTPEERWQDLLAWENAPGARAAHPREEHLLPLMVAVGAAHAEKGKLDFSEMIGGKAYSCYRFGG
ncbi:DODA-type extradiol aromatic ring-opening family dioxygenase [Kordiimonas gwangyangensis]|uniref:DODA-type extradiol aromatic ring-opening family dioxygenase n=1 Tax=Kordiimonas gwangyangensis TaxID=288022 RepID=UPI00036C3830|nr:class III extradiol ring-cleavage dioxygenase [Kordiimonas gwangyangensis]